MTATASKFLRRRLWAQIPPFPALTPRNNSELPDRESKNL